MENQTSRFNVVIRVRPNLGDERNDLTTEEDLFVCTNKISEKEVRIFRPSTEEVRIFDFDRILSRESQEETYNTAAKKIVEDVMNGYNGTVMAYGQTGSGKTYTIFGTKNSVDFNDVLGNETGMVPRAVRQIFDTIRNADSKIQFSVKVSFMQVYMESITDLIQEEGDGEKEQVKENMIFSSNKKSVYGIKEGLQIREDPKTGIFVKGLKQIRVTDEEELMLLIQYGSKFRITNATSMNKDSSRSHAILQIMVEQKWVETIPANENNHSISNPNISQNDHSATPDVVKKRHHKKGLLTIVDLAGSERISKSGSEGLRLEEAKKINTSITALGSCIFALANNTNLQHVPFRDSKLTRILTECLSGNSKTSIYACVSPLLMNYDETITTLQFASRAIKIRLSVHVNERIEMKKMKDKIQDSTRIRGHENTVKDHKKLERDASELKSSINLLKQELKKAKLKSEGKIKDEKEDKEISKFINKESNKEASRDIKGSPLKTSNELNNSSNVNQHMANYNTHSAEFININKKFHSMILHLQSELAKATITIENLKEENKYLRDKVKKEEKQI